MSEEHAVEDVTWWAPGAVWRQASPPLPFISFLADQQDWDTAVKEAGYDQEDTTEDKFGGGGATVFLHTDGHLWINMVELGWFFVAAEHKIPFWADKWQEFRDADLRRRSTEAAEMQAKALVAFVRHGHGETTIDEYGSETRDERNRNRERERWAKEQAKLKAARQSS